MLDTLVKLVLIAATSPLWLPILRSLREQLEEIEAQEREHEQGGRASSRPAFGPAAAVPSENDELVEQRLAPARAGGRGFRDEDVPVRRSQGFRRAG